MEAVLIALVIAAVFVAGCGLVRLLEFLDDERIRRQDRRTDGRIRSARWE